MREQLINIIEQYGGDELELNDWIEISKENETQLIDRVNNILEYYYNETKN